MKFSEIPYQRLTVEQVAPQVEQLIAALDAATNGCEACEVYERYNALVVQVESTVALVYIRNHLDTTDALYAAEQDYYDEQIPRLTELLHGFATKLMLTPHLKALEDKYGEQAFRRTAIELRTFSPAILEDMQEENRLETQYTKLLASAQIDFDGGVYTLAQLAAFHVHADRDVRKRSMETKAAWFESHKAEFDELYDKLVALRTQMGRKMGYDNYLPLGYDRRARDCYGPAEVAKFRAAVVEHIVPVAHRLKREQAARIGADALTLFDDGFLYKSGNAAPIGTPEEIFANGKKMYHELSDETGRFIDDMLDMDAFDVLARQNKAGGGFCYSMSAYNLPFIFANFNGTSDDIETLTHEAGHAFAAWEAYKYPAEAQRNPTYDAAETHSMSMEFLTWPWMELFYGGQTDKFKQSHLAGALTFLPYGVMVDHFQHIVYENPSLSPQQRCDEWKKLEAIYRPWLDYDMPFYGEGRRWMGQGHIYTDPLYYIDYCFAQANALSVWALAQQDAADAWRRYYGFVSLAGTKNFVDLNHAAGLGDPFSAETLKRVATEALAWLDEQPKLD